MSTLEAILLGLIQGLTEFLPVSSSGHLVLAQRAFGWEATGLALEISVHAATLLAVLLVLRKDVGELLRGALDVVRGRAASADARLFVYVAAGTIPAVVLGLLMKDTIERVFGQPRWAAVGLLVTAAILVATRWRRRPERGLTVLFAILIGCAQALAILPGISRSGSTIAVALLLGIAPRRAFAFSFLLSIPAILGATVLMLPGMLSGGSSGGLVGLCLVAAAASFVSGVVALILLRGVVEAGRLIWFAPYCAAVGFAALVLLS